VKKTPNIDSNKTNKNSINLLLLGLASVTLYFNTKANDPFNTHKLIIILVLSGWFFGYVVTHYKNTRVAKNSTNFYLFVLILIFLSAQVISLFMSDAFIVGFIGETQRKNGLLTYFALSVILLYTSIRFSFKDSTQFLKGTILIGLILATYGTIQILGKDFVKWNNPHNSMLGTLGNPNFASALLAIVVLLSIFSLIHKPLSVGYKVIAIVVVVLALLSIWESNSRQGLLVTGIGLLIYFSLNSYFNGNRYKYFIPLVSLGIITIATLGMLQKGPAAYYLYKESVSVRGFYWKAAIQMFESSPLFGIGLDRYGSYFKEFRDPDYPLRFGYEISSTNAHNTFLQFFSTGGILVGTSYLLLMTLIFFTGLRNVRHTRNEERKISLALLAVWVAFQSQSLISIDNIGISIWGWILGGAIIGLHNNRLNDSQHNKVASKRESIDLFQVGIAASVLTPIIFISILLHRQEADLYVAKSAVMQKTVNQQLALINSQKVLDNKLADPYYKYEASIVLAELGKVEVSNIQIKALSKADPRNLYFLDWLLSNELRKANYQSALRIALQMEEYDPWNVKNIFLIGELYKQLGELNKMEEVRLKVNKIAPNSEIAIQANQILV